MNDPAVRRFVALESEVWEALVAGDPEADLRLLTDDFLGVYPHGFESRSDHAAHLGHGPIVADYRIDEARIHEIATGVVLLSYRARYRGVAAGTVSDEATMYITSIWRRDGGAWRNSFSQDTPAI